MNAIVQQPKNRIPYPRMVKAPLRYAEDRWEKRFGCDFVFYCVDCHEPPTSPLSITARTEQNEAERKAAQKLAAGWLRSQCILASIPTVLLAGMYGAAAFSLLSIGPAFAGFLTFAIPTSLVSAWANSGSS